MGPTQPDDKQTTAGTLTWCQERKRLPVGCFLRLWILKDLYAFTLLNNKELPILHLKAQMYIIEGRREEKS